MKICSLLFFWLYYAYAATSPNFTIPDEKSLLNAGGGTRSTQTLLLDDALSHIAGINTPLSGADGGERPSGDVGLCVIATAAYGSPMAEHVLLLREFRDQYLVATRIGRSFVAFYYWISPPLARFIQRYPLLKPAVRLALLPAVATAAFFVKTTPLQRWGAGVTGGIFVIVILLCARSARKRF